MWNLGEEFIDRLMYFFSLDVFCLFFSCRIIEYGS